MPPTTAHGISIATVFDNYAADPRLATSWGFAAAVIAADTAVPDIFTIGPLGNGLDEQALVVETEEGLVFITGRAHPGVVRIVEAASRTASGSPVGSWPAQKMLILP